MRYKIYSNTERGWDAMLSSIDSAKSSIFLEMYIFSDNTSDTHNFVEILSKKALSGLKVKLVLDSLGTSGGLMEESVSKLKNAGVEILFFKKLFRYTHRKVLIIDEKVAFIGGINIGKLYKKWHDLQIKIDGAVVKPMLRSFARIYKKCGGTDPFVLKHDKMKLIQKGKVLFFEHFMNKGPFRLNKYYRDKIDNAHESIVIATPYLMPNRWLIEALKKASERGVKVEIILPKKADPWIGNWPNYLYMNKLYPSGARFFLTEEMIHSKAMLVDGAEGILGSHNIDVLSFELNMESGIFFNDKKIVDSLYKVVDFWKKDSIPFTPKMRNNYFFDHFVDFCLSIFEYALRIFNFITT